MLENPKSPKIKRLTRLLQKKYRKEQKEFLVEGPQAVRELLVSSKANVKEVFITQPALSRNSEINRLIQKTDITVTFVTDKVIRVLSDTVNPQGIVAHTKIKEVSLEQALQKAQLVAVLHEVRDPGNAGAVLRAADAAGADAVIFADESIDPWHPKVVRATTGSLFHLNVVHNVSLQDVLKTAKQANLLTIAADVRGRDLNPHDETLEQPVAWIFGNEARGLKQQDRENCDEVLKLPIYGKAESLNLATAAAVCLYSSAFALRKKRFTE